MGLKKKDFDGDRVTVYSPVGKRVSSTTVTLMPDGNEVVEVNFEPVPTVDPVVLAFQKVDRG